MEAIQLPAPFAGVDELTPLAALQAPYCESLINCNTQQEGCVVRNGDSKAWQLTYTPGHLDVGGFAVYGNTKLILTVYDSNLDEQRFYDVEAGSSLKTQTGITTNTNYQTIYYNGNLYFFREETGAGIADNWRYDGTTWTSVGFTGYTRSPSVIPGCLYKNRIFLIDKSASFTDPYYWYSNLYDSAGLTLAGVSLDYIFSVKSRLAIIAAITLSDNVEVNNLIAFINFEGEVLFYAGSYPDSPDWRLLGRAQISTPVNYNSGFAYQGDYLILTDAGLVSLRDLFLKGSQEAQIFSVSRQVSKTWNFLVKKIRDTVGTPVGRLQDISGVFDLKNNRLIITFPYIPDVNAGTISAGGYWFVYNCLLKSWSMHKSVAGGTYQDIAYYKNKVYTVAQKEGNPSSALIVYQKEGSTAYTDRNFLDTADVGYDYEIKSAPITTGRAQYAKISSMDVIVKSDLHAETNYQVISDLGVNTSVAQKVNGQSGVLSKPNIPMGISGTYIQYKISGTTSSGKTSGYQLYGTNLWIDKGNSPR